MPATSITRFLNAARLAGFHSLRYAPILIAVVIAGCSSLQPVATEPEILQENIRAGTAVHEGDTVRVVTRDGVSHRLVVTAVQENILQGYVQGARTDSIVIEIPVDDILALENEKYRAGEQVSHLFGTIEIAVVFIFIFAALLLG
jgi:hypothetical protein